jgi:hypothetical protein
MIKTNHFYHNYISPNFKPPLPIFRSATKSHTQAFGLPANEMSRSDEQSESA